MINDVIRKGGRESCDYANGVPSEKADAEEIPLVRCFVATTGCANQVVVSLLPGHLLRDLLPCGPISNLAIAAPEGVHEINTAQ